MGPYLLGGFWFRLGNRFNRYRDDIPMPPLYFPEWAK